MYRRPRPPYRLYTGVEIDFSKLPFPTHQHSKDRLSVSKVYYTNCQPEETTAGVYVRKKLENGEFVERRGIPSGYMIDNKGCGWIAVRQLIGHAEAMARQLRLPPDFDTRYEHILSEVPSDPKMQAHNYERELGSIKSSFTWQPIADVTGVFPLYFVAPKTFQRKLDDKIISRINSAYVRYPIS